MDNIPTINDDNIKKVTINILIGDLSIAEDVKKIKELQKGEKPKHLTDEQWESWKEASNKIINNLIS